MNAPKRGKKYQEVLNKGCGGYQCGNPIDGYDFDCEHDYEWDCDNCPIVVEIMKKEEK